MKKIQALVMLLLMSMALGTVYTAYQATSTATITAGDELATAVAGAGFSIDEVVSNTMVDVDVTKPLFNITAIDENHNDSLGIVLVWTNPGEIMDEFAEFSMNITVYQCNGTSSQDVAADGVYTYWLDRYTHTLVFYPTESTHTTTFSYYSLICTELTYYCHDAPAEPADPSFYCYVFAADEKEPTIT